MRKYQDARVSGDAESAGGEDLDVGLGKFSGLRLAGGGETVEVVGDRRGGGGGLDHCFGSELAGL